jgi:hypothetical protein
VHLKASTKPHVHRKFEIFWTNIASTMACPNFKKGPKKGLGPLGVKEDMTHYWCIWKVPLKKIKLKRKISLRWCIEEYYEWPIHIKQTTFIKYWFLNELIITRIIEYLHLFKLKVFLSCIITYVIKHVDSIKNIFTQ